MSQSTIETISSAIKGLSAVGKLKAEIELLTNSSDDVVYRLRYDNMQYDYISPSVKKLLGYDVKELKKVNLRSLIMETRIVNNDMQQVESYSGLEETRRNGEVQKWQADYLMKTKDNRQIWVADISYPWFDKKGAIIGSTGSLRNITERKLAEQRIRDEVTRFGSIDRLTGLVNGHKLWDKLEAEMKRSRRTDAPVSLFLLEIDNIEKITTLSGERANGVLVEIASILKKSLREIDVPARVDNAKFAALLVETGEEGATFVAKRISDAIKKHKFSAIDDKIVCKFSTGIASNSLKEADVSSIYKTADSMLHLAKTRGY